MGITEQPTAFYFDRAVSVFGRRFQQELDGAEQGKKSEARKTMARNMVMARWLGVQAFASGPKGGQK